MCLLSLWPGRESAEDAVRRRAADDSDEDDPNMVDIREEQQLDEEARRTVGALIIAETLQTLRKRAEVGS